MLVSAPEDTPEIGHRDTVGNRRRDSLIELLVEAAIGLLFGISSAPCPTGPDPVGVSSDE